MGTTRDSQHAQSLSASPPRRPDDARTPAPRTLIVSDVRLFREGLALGLGGRGDVALVGTADSLESARAAIAAAVPEIVLLDTGMRRALEVARLLLRADAAIRIVGVAVAEEGADVMACGEAGMAGFVPRDGSIDDVAMAIHDVMRGELQCSPRMAATLFKHLASSAPQGAPTHATPLLTPREVEVVELIDRGLSNKQIGQRLRIGTATVKNHVHSILEKLHVSRRAEAAASVRASQAVLPSFSRRASGATPMADPSI